MPAWPWLMERGSTVPPAFRYRLDLDGAVLGPTEGRRNDTSSPSGKSRDTGREGLATKPRKLIILERWTQSGDWGVASSVRGYREYRNS